MNPSDLEARLGRLDLQLDGGGEHLDDERIAELGAGAEPSEPEAAHLAGCDECLELLVALGEGLEALALDDPALGALMAEPPRPKRSGRRWTPLMLVALAGVAAAAGWFARESAPEAPKPAPSAPAVEAGPDEVPILPADAVIGSGASRDAARLPSVGQWPEAPREAVPAEAEAPVEAQAPAVPGEPPVAPGDLQVETPVEAAPPSDGMAADAVQAPDVPFEATRPTPRPAPPRTPRRLPPPEATPTPGALARPDGPRPLERRPVDGPPRGFGWLQLNTRPPARVFVDDKPRGWTPIIDLRLPEGPHDVRLVFESELAAEPEQRFRVLIEPDRTWRMTRDNVRKASP